MPTPGLNGHPGRVPVRLGDAGRDEMLRRIEDALGMMDRALVMSGFSEYEAGEVNLATRAAITTKVKQRFGSR